MTMRKFAIRILALALPLYAGASASTDISGLPLDEQADGTRANASVPTNWSESVTTVVEIAIPPAAAPSAPAERALSANPLWAMPLKQFSATRDRPIFLPSRRPPAPAATAVATSAIAVPKPKEPERPQLSLVGTISGDDDKFGIFLDQSTKAVLRLKVGEDFQGWKLRSVQGQQVALEKSQSTVVLAMPQPNLAQASVTIRNEAAASDNTVNLMPPGTHFRHDR
jgi:hypothetical protein